MLNIFPSLLTYSFFVPTLLRGVIGIIFFIYACQMLFGSRELYRQKLHLLGLRPATLFVWIIGSIELIASLLLLVGLWTQVAALVLSLGALGVIVAKLLGSRQFANSIEYSILLFVVTLSLMFLGAGGFAFDLPL